MGLLNEWINRNRFPIMLHGNFCGPGNDVIRQIKDKVHPVSILDSYCKEHDLAYNKFNDLKARHAADEVLSSKAFSRVKDSKATLKERLAALAVCAAMKGKLAIGAGFRSSKKKPCTKNQQKTKMRPRQNAKRRMRRRGKKVRGGFLPALIPILAGLSAIGGIGSGVSQIIKNVKDTKRGDLELEELKRHNMAMEGQRKSGGSHGINSTTISTKKRRRQSSVKGKKKNKEGKGFIMNQYKRC